MSAAGNQPRLTADRGAAVVAIYWTQATIAIVVVAARFYTRKRMRILGADDWLMLVTLILFTIIASLVTWQSCLGGFRHLPEVPKEQITKVSLLNYVMQDIGIFSYVTGKASVGCLILRFLGPKSSWRRWVIWVVVIMTLVVNSINCILTLVQCDPPRGLWDHSVPAHCWNPKIQADFAMFVGAENVLADIVLALLPATIFWNLKMPLEKRINLCVLLGLGLLAAIAGIVKTSYLGSLTAHSDLTWETYNLVVWSGAEDFVIIICGSIPPLKPFWDHHVKNKDTFASRRSHSGYHSDYQSGKNMINLRSASQYASQPSSISSQDDSLNPRSGTKHESNILVISDIEVRGATPGSVV